MTKQHPHETREAMNLRCSGTLQTWKPMSVFFEQLSIISNEGGIVVFKCLVRRVRSKILIFLIILLAFTNESIVPKTSLHCMRPIQERKTLSETCEQFFKVKNQMGQTNSGWLKVGSRRGHSHLLSSHLTIFRNRLLRFLAVPPATRIDLSVYHHLVRLSFICARVKCYISGISFFVAVQAESSFRSLVSSSNFFWKNPVLFWKWPPMPTMLPVPWLHKC